MRFEMVVAMNQKGVIGKNGKLPWNVPEDLKLFKLLTERQIVIMGRKTYDSLPDGPLINRINIVITRNPSKYISDNTEKLIFCDFQQLRDILKNLDNGSRKAMVIGGADIFREFFYECKIFHITLIHNEKGGDTLFPYEYRDFLDNEQYKCVCKFADPVKSKGGSGDKYQYFCYSRFL